jgi:uncharacterized protein YaiL (DUF2058 family)
VKKSLQDQLIKAGLGNKQQARQINHAKKKNKGKGAPEVTESLAAAQRAAQQEKDRQRNLDIQIAAEEKAKLVQIIQLIESNKITPPTRGLPYYYVFNNKIRKCKVDDKMRIRLAYGQIGIVQLPQVEGHCFYFVSEATLEKLRSRKADQYIVWSHSPSSFKDYLATHEMEDWNYPKDLFE